MVKKDLNNRNCRRASNLRALIEERVMNFLNRQPTLEERKVVAKSKAWNDLWEDHEGFADIYLCQVSVRKMLLEGLPVPFPRNCSKHLIRPFSGYHDANKRYGIPKHVFGQPVTVKLMNI